MRADVVVFGDALLDVHVTPTNPMRRGGDVPAAIRLEPGGQGANLAVRLARRGIDVRLVCATAADPAGEMVRAALGADRVELMDVGAEQTGVVVVLLDGERDRTMLSRRAPLFARLASQHDWGAVLDTSWLVVSGYALLEPAAGMSATGAEPRRAVVGCSLDAAQAPAWERAAVSLKPHVVVLSHDEARTMGHAAADPVALSRGLGAKLGAVVVVTHPAGAVATLAGATVEVAAPTSGPAVDTTGAGDAFAAALIAELLADAWPPGADSLEAAMGAATRLASAVAGVVGAQGRVATEPTRTDES